MSEREQLELIVKCDPTWLLIDIKKNTHFDAALLEKVFELAKAQARSILASVAIDALLQEVHGYLRCVVDGSMSRNNAQTLASELIEDIDAIPSKEPK